MNYEPRPLTVETLREARDLLMANDEQSLQTLTASQVRERERWYWEEGPGRELASPQAHNAWLDMITAKAFEALNIKIDDQIISAFTSAFKTSCACARCKRMKR